MYLVRVRVRLRVRVRVRVRLRVRVRVRVIEAASSEPSRPSASIFCGALFEFRRSSGGGEAPPSIGGGEAGEERGRLCWLCRTSKFSALVKRPCLGLHSK